MCKLIPKAQEADPDYTDLMDSENAYDQDEQGYQEADTSPLLSEFFKTCSQQQ